jgi:hypothetical protein
VRTTVAEKKPDIPIRPVDKPILRLPYDEPTDHWLFDTQTGRASDCPCTTCRAPLEGDARRKAPPPGDEGADRLAEVLRGPWVVLNPAHGPDYPQIRNTGFAKVGVVRSKERSAGPTLRSPVEAGARFRDGAETPLAVVHVNNLSGDGPQTACYAEAAFGDTEDRVRQVHGPVSGPDSSWRPPEREPVRGQKPLPVADASWPCPTGRRSAMGVILFQASKWVVYSMEAACSFLLVGGAVKKVLPDPADECIG